jgi:hypothetical protein
VKRFSEKIMRKPTLTPVEQDAGDDEHRCHRQHMRERSRGRPLGGFLHAFTP